jgi:hypothetical protein
MAEASAGGEIGGIAIGSALIQPGIGRACRPAAPITVRLQRALMRIRWLWIVFLLVLSVGRTTNTITAGLDNATDKLYFNHLNYLKDLAPEMGANFRVVYNVKL